MRKIDDDVIDVVVANGKDLLRSKALKIDAFLLSSIIQELTGRPKEMVIDGLIR
jgi:hypothetical protein